MTSPSLVRLATPQDEEGLMDLCRALHAENAIFKMNEDKVRHFIRLAWVGNGGAIVGAIGKPEHIEGAIYMVIGQYWYSDDKHLEEYFNYVRPEHRKSKHAQKLIEFAKELSDRTLPLVIGVISSKRTEAKIKLYERQLGKQAGALFVFNRNLAGGPAATAE